MTGKDIFDEREKSYEAKYKLDEERRFKAMSRRNKLLGLWAAGQMGMSRNAAEDYAKEVIVASLDAPGDDGVIAKVMNDLEDQGGGVTEEQLRNEMERLFGLALEQITNDYPAALDTDHEQVGG